MLKPPAARLRFHRQVRDEPRPVTSTLRCPIDIGALRAYSAQHSSSVGRTINCFLDFCAPSLRRRIDDDTGYLDIQYRHSALTAALIDAGWLTDGREYAIGAKSGPTLSSSQNPCATSPCAGSGELMTTPAPGPVPLPTSFPYTVASVSPSSTTAKLFCADSELSYSLGGAPASSVRGSSGFSPG